MDPWTIYSRQITVSGRNGRSFQELQLSKVFNFYCKYWTSIKRTRKTGVCIPIGCQSHHLFVTLKIQVSDCEFHKKCTCYASMFKRTYMNQWPLTITTKYFHTTGSCQHLQHAYYVLWTFYAITIRSICYYAGQIINASRTVGAAQEFTRRILKAKRASLWSFEQKEMVFCSLLPIVMICQNCTFS